MPRSHLTRRGFIGSAVVVAAAQSSADEPTPTAASPRPITGEPYELPGKRLVFTNWLWVRPGGFGWFNAAGQNVTVAGSELPGAAALRKTDHPLGIRIRCERAERRGPIIGPEMPWEKGGKGLNVAAVLHDQGRFRAWGACPAGPCLWESTDGLKWQRPKLGIVDHAGTKDNNLLAMAPGTVFVDPSAPAGERYKAVTLDGISHDEFEAFRKRRPDAWEPRAERKDVGHIYAVRGAVSPDGVRWTRLPEPFCVEHSDTQLVAYHDARTGRYVIYTRNYMIAPRALKAPGDNIVWWGGDANGPGRRSIGRTESADFRAFPVSEVILSPGPDLLPDDTLYTNCRTTIPGAPDLHLMFPAVWHTSNDTTSLALASSWDGRVWNWVPGGTVFETAPFGQWDGGCLFAQPNLLELPDGSFALPYTGYNVPHKYPRGQWAFAPGMAVWPKGRIVAVEAEGRGEFATVSFIHPGGPVLVNAVTRRTGSLRMEAADAAGRPLPGMSFGDAQPLVGDCFRKPAAWKSGDHVKAGTVVMLRFRIDQAKLYGLEFQ